MPKHKEIISLEDLAVTSLENYVMELIVCAISESGSGVTPREIHIERLNEFLHADLHPILSSKVTNGMLQLFTTRIFGDYYISGPELEAIGNVITASLGPHLQILDMTGYQKYLYRTLTKYMHKFQKLHTLSSYLTDEPEVTGLFLTSLCSFKFLVNFQMKSFCTDAVIIILALNNHETIQKIDVTNSEEVTDASFKSLIKCNKLKELLISETLMKAKGYVEFLQDKMYHDTVRRFVNLSVGCFDDEGFSSGELDETARVCPNLRELAIVKLRGNMTKLCNLTGLEKLEIWRSDFLQYNLDTFLRVRGSNLILLELVEVASLEFMCIVNHCVNLKELLVIKCTMTDMALGKPFLNLEKLHLEGKYPRNLVEYTLSSCTDMRSLYLRLRSGECITDDDILRLLLLSNFRKLKYLYLSCKNNDLSIKSANSIIELCPSLEELENLSAWHGITRQEINNLRKQIEEKNLDLRIH